MKKRFTLDEIFIATTAAKYMGMPYTTLKDDLTRYDKFDEQIKKGLVKKEGRIWILTKQALIEVYGVEDS